ncbi:MAG: phage holin family protein [bacterium]|nr:phage holin family protein [bacterium]
MASWIGLAVRFVVSALVLMFVGFLLPGFEIAGFTNALIAAVAIAIIGYIAEALLGRRVSPQSRGVVGFITAAVVIYAAQFVVPLMRVTVIGALLASVIIGLLDAVVPTELR